MDPSFGTRLRQQRERQQVTLGAIAEQTKIKPSLLEELERDDISHWPSGIYRRSYLRSYARAIGLDPDTTVREFLQLYPDAVEETADITAARDGSGDDPLRRPPTRLRYLIDSAIAAFPRRRPQPPLDERPLEDDTASAPYIDFVAAHDSPLDVRRQIGGDSGLAHAHDDELTMADAETEHTVEALAIEFAAPPEPVRETLPIPEPIPSPDLTLATPADAPPPAPSANTARSNGVSGAETDLPAVAAVCTRLARARDTRDLADAIAGAATVLRAVGIIVWVWDARGRVLIPLFSSGYASEMLAQLPGVPVSAENAIGAAFRSLETQAVAGSMSETGALVVPLLTPGSCAGVLAIELRDGGECHPHVRAMATILAAQLSTLVEGPPASDSKSA